jgi:hypothetical protein
LIEEVTGGRFEVVSDGSVLWAKFRSQQQTTTSIIGKKIIYSEDLSPFTGPSCQHAYFLRRLQGPAIGFIIFIFYLLKFIG